MTKNKLSKAQIEAINQRKKEIINHFVNNISNKEIIENFIELFSNYYQNRFSIEFTVDSTMNLIVTIYANLKNKKSIGVSALLVDNNNNNKSRSIFFYKLLRQMTDSLEKRIIRIAIGIEK